MSFHRIRVSPYATNILDLIADKTPLVTEDGRAVTIRRVNCDKFFEVVVAEDAPQRFAGNIEASAYVDMLSVGVRSK